MESEKNSSLYKNWHQFKCINANTNTTTISVLLENIDGYIRRGEIIKAGRATTVAVVSIGSNDMVQNFFVKRYNSKGFFYSLFRSIIPSRALIAWKASWLLKSVGIPTPSPLAILEKRWGPIKWESYIIYDFYPEAIHASRFFLEGAQPTEMWPSVAKKIINILTLLKKNKIIHGDLKAQNFIISNNNPLLVDLDSLKQIKNINVFNKYHKKDIKRFKKNWIKNKKTGLLFKYLLK
ncbi:hypothetical protein CI610_02371 [invertebrate metagenome]|uniref:Non-specific serine/threonine protein kinase n=1 Tax=invertebrate metagenome TaxID=1711999 RepID=A0A2H9T638_9ZZZZ